MAMTKKEKYQELLNILEEVGKDEYDYLATFINEEIRQLDRKSRPSQKTIAKREANAELAEILYDVMTTEYNTLTYIVKGVEALEDLSTSKVAYLMKTLVDSGRVEKTYNGRISEYRKKA